ncbi:hypothetical protein IF1G_03196 [Cordyceps javanica]|uniref:Uncharacterized protein n=1 Tax=Cordyceps javanica TaxID=43265 RepID=A0A545V6X4_9HYPO|nr:hypothetical protein IF1G_03196 [Cordyceps javanica]
MSRALVTNVSQLDAQPRVQERSPMGQSVYAVCPELHFGESILEMLFVLAARFGNTRAEIFRACAYYNYHEARQSTPPSPTTPGPLWCIEICWRFGEAASTLSTLAGPKIALPAFVVGPGRTVHDGGM